MVVLRVAELMAVPVSAAVEVEKVSEVVEEVVSAPAPQCLAVECDVS